MSQRSKSYSLYPLRQIARLGPQWRCHLSHCANVIRAPHYAKCRLALLISEYASCPPSGQGRVGRHVRSPHLVSLMHSLALCFFGYIVRRHRESAHQGFHFFTPHRFAHLHVTACGETAGLHFVNAHHLRMRHAVGRDLVEAYQFRDRSTIASPPRADWTETSDRRTVNEPLALDVRLPNT